MTRSSLRLCRRAAAAGLASALRPMLAGAAFAVAAAPLAGPASAFAGTPDQLAAHPYAPHVAEASGRFGIPQNWIWSVMRAESRGNSRAVSGAGAMGLMQIMPGTWATLTARHALGSDPFDVRANILGGTAYLREMWDRYRDVRLMLAAYNAGPGRADDYRAGRRRLPAETIAYVAQIAPGLGTSGIASRAAVPSPAAPSWRDASVFTAHGDREPADKPDAVAVQPTRTESTLGSAADRPSNLSPHPFFVPLSGRSE